MAEELDGQLAAEPEVVPAEGETQGQSDPNVNDEAPDPIEALASEMGWAPKDQFRGDEADWKPAADFIKAGRDINRSMARELRGVREEVSRIARTSAQITADKIAERDAYWQDVHAKAVDEGDGVTARKAVDELVKLKAATPATDAPPPETNEFISKHKSWFGVDPLATSRAKRIAAELAEEGYDTTEQLRQVERAIRKEFPEHFDPPAKRPAGVQTATSRNANNSGRAKGFADMPAESQAMARDFLARHGVPLEKTAASYWADIERNERKVG